MIRIKKIPFRQVLVDEISSESLNEVRKMGPFDPGRAWEIRSNGELVLVFGINIGALVGDVSLWMLAGTGLSAKVARRLKYHMPKLLNRYGRLIVGVDAGFGAGCRFAEFMGFRRKTMIGPYVYYEARKQWPS